MSINGHRSLKQLFLKKIMDSSACVEKVMAKREFSALPREDVLRAFFHFSRRQVSDKEKIRLTRELLHKVYGSFVSPKLLSVKDKDFSWMLRKHLSTRERLPFYAELYKRLVHSGETVFDLGCGINGFSFSYFPSGVSYVGVEAVGQLVTQMNSYFARKDFCSRAVHASLFDISFLQKLLTKERGKKVIFLFKVIDSLEMLERDFSKKLLLALVPLAERVVVSFATRSMISRRRFSVQRFWIFSFLQKHFSLLDDFVLGDERYLVFCKR